LSAFHVDTLSIADRIRDFQPLWSAIGGAREDS
jgi:hypothetical protein